MKSRVRVFQIALFGAVVLISLLAFIYSRWDQAKDQKFLKALNLQVTLKVIDIKQTGDHGYGVIFGKIIKSNKPERYAAAYQNEYTFCKIEKGKILFVSDFYVYEKNDSVIINSSLSKYWVYRNSKLVSEYNLTTTTDNFLYMHLEGNKYLDFDTYKN